jgi:hypothetical protein
MEARYRSRRLSLLDIRVGGYCRRREGMVYRRDDIVGGRISSNRVPGLEWKLVNASEQS